MTCRLDGQVAIVTGAARGLGRAYALALADAGAAVVVNDVDTASDAGPGEVVHEIRVRGGRALGVLESVADPSGVQRLIDESVAAFGRLDILVNNAGIVRRQPIVDLSVTDFDVVIAVHLRGTFLCTRAAMRTMRAGGRGGRIINVTSGAAYLDPLPGSPTAPASAAYAAAKGGIISFTRVAAAEGKEFGVTCNAVSPLARTRMSAQYLAPETDAALDPAAVAPMLVFLASDAAAAITGQVFRVARGEIAVVRSGTGPALRCSGSRWTPEEIATRINEICAPTASS